VAQEHADGPEPGQGTPEPDDETWDDEGLEAEGGDDQEELVDDQGRRHIRRAAPAGTDEILEAEESRQTGLPGGLERWRRRSATGAVLTAFAFGLQQALDAERKEPAIIMQTSGTPPTDLPVEAQLEQLGPSRSVVTVRPWLLGGGDALGGPVGAQDEPAPEGEPPPGTDEVRP
jgi:hypothetical protein